MTAWTSGELERIGAADELQLASAREDGALRKPVTIWVVRLGDDLYVRSVNGRTSHWFRGTEDRQEGHIRAAGVEKDVRFVEADNDVNDEIDNDESLQRNQDDEFNLRVRLAGGRIVLDPAIRGHYTPRGSLQGVFRQYYEYGLWKVPVMLKHGQLSSPRSFGPLFFVSTLLGLAPAAMLSRAGHRLLGIELSVYAATAVASAGISIRRRRESWSLLPRVIAVFPAFHSGYGLGMLVGWGRAAAPRATLRPSSPMRTHALMYHDVVNGDPDRSGFAGAGPARYKLSTARFREHLDALREALSDEPGVVDDLLTGGSGGAAWLLTFDDGGSSALAAGEELARRHWRGHFFITTGRIGEQGFLGASEIIELRRMGHIIGSHSASHPSRMSSLPEPELLDEWRRSVESLADLLGGEIQSASVPGGYYRKRVARAAAEAGIVALFTSGPVRKPRYVGECLVIGRLSVRSSMSAAEACQIAGGASRPWLGEWVGWNVRGSAKALFGRRYERLRGAVLSQRSELEHH